MIYEKIVDFVGLFKQKLLGFILDQRTVSGRNIEFVIFVYFYRFHGVILTQNAKICKY